MQIRCSCRCLIVLCNINPLLSEFNTSPSSHQSKMGVKCNCVMMMSSISHHMHAIYFLLFNYFSNPPWMMVWNHGLINWTSDCNFITRKRIFSYLESWWFTMARCIGKFFFSYSSLDGDNLNFYLIENFKINLMCVWRNKRIL